MSTLTEKETEAEALRDWSVPTDKLLAELSWGSAELLWFSRCEPRPCAWHEHGGFHRPWVPLLPCLLLATLVLEGGWGWSQGGWWQHPGPGKCSIFILVAALYLASVEGKGHFCAYPKARTHQTLQRRCWLPLCEGAGRMGNQWTSDVKKQLGLVIRELKRNLGDPGSRHGSDFHCHLG